MKKQNTHQTFAIRIVGLLASVLMTGWVAGCSTAKSVADSEGHGRRQVFHVSYDTAWTAARGAVAMNDLRVVDLNRQTGFILAKHDINMTTFGEHVAVWVHPISSNVTSIEVVSRHAGPPIAPGWDMEKPILKHIATMVDE